MLPLWSTAILEDNPAATLSVLHCRCCAKANASGANMRRSKLKSREIMLVRRPFRSICNNIIPFELGPLARRCGNMAQFGVRTLRQVHLRAAKNRQNDHACEQLIAVVKVRS